MKNKKTIIPIKMRAEMSVMMEYKSCMLYGHNHPKTGDTHSCEGRVTWEHAIIYAGNKIQEKWAIIAICEKAHAVDNFQDAGTMVKELNQWIALNRGTDEELLKYSSPAFRLTKVHERDRLNKIYGVWQQKYQIDDKPIVSPIQPQPKAFWYPISGPEKLIVDKAMEFHRNVFDTAPSPFEMIRHMIDSYQMVIDSFPEICDVYPQIYTKLNNPRAPKQKYESDNK